jgi:transposase
MRLIGILALARKLLIALWRYLEHGVIPEGAIIKGASSKRRYGTREILYAVV